MNYELATRMDGNAWNFIIGVLTKYRIGFTVNDEKTIINVEYLSLDLHIDYNDCMEAIYNVLNHMKSELTTSDGRLLFDCTWIDTIMSYLYVNIMNYSYEEL